MQSFLNLAAQKIFSSHKINELQNVRVILPSRRAVFFFKKDLASFSEIPFFSPQIESIDDFLSEVSGLQPLDNIDLYFEIFKILQDVDPNQNFEKFMTWVPTLLKDFENIDFALVDDPHLLFKYMSEAEAISRWELDQEYVFTDNAKSYFNFFDKISIVYERLRKLLIDNKKCYRGLMYRFVSENISDLENSDIEKYYFVGLNALSKAEEKIIESLVKAKKAECIWDSDDYFMNSSNKAGKKLRGYKRSGKYGSWNFQSSLLATSSKNIQIFEVNNESLQAKLANEFAQKYQEDSHVIVVLDEGQFLPLMLNVPAAGVDYNISIGLPIGNSSFSSILEIILENFQNFSNSDLPKIHHSQLLKIIDHKILKIILIDKMGFEKYFELTQKIIDSKKVFFTEKWLNDNALNNEILSYFFKKGNVKDCIETILSIVEHFFEIENPIAGDLEFIFANVLVQKLNIVKTKIAENIDFSFKSFKVLLKELLKNERVPFEGDSSTSLQIMSMLETRCLDFKNVTILSFNEGNLPSNKKSNSFIPFDAAKYFGLPLYSDQDAIMAYHFFRLMQRAVNLNFIYLNSANEVLGSKEKSRFIRQVEEELSINNPFLNITYPIINFGEIDKKGVNEEIIVSKNKEIINSINKYLTLKGLSATAITDYLTCSLKFYWKKIEKIQNDEELKENMGADVFGKIIHRVLEVLDQPYLNKTIDKSTLEHQKASISGVLAKILKEDHELLETNSGLNFILVSVASKILEKYFDKKIAETNLPFTILNLESEFVSKIKINGIDLNINGVIDKIESHGKNIHVIDYKTGKVESKDVMAKEGMFLETILEPKKEKLRQLFIYFYLLSQNIDKIPTKSLNDIILKIYSFKNLKENIVFSSTDSDSHEIIESVEELLKLVVGGLLDEETPFEQTKDLKVCSYCDFSNICRK